MYIHSLVFQAKSNASLQLSLVSISGSTEYVLEIGGSANTKTILKDSQGTILQSKVWTYQNVTKIILEVANNVLLKM